MNQRKNLLELMIDAIPMEGIPFLTVLPACLCLLALGMSGLWPDVGLFFVIALAVTIAAGVEWLQAIEKRKATKKKRK